MGLSKNITLTIKDYEIKLDKEIKFYENDTIDLCFSILEYGIEVKDGVSINKLMPIQALTAYMLIETPQGVDYAESTKIEDNKIVFKLGSKYSQFVGIGHMQIVIKDSDGCRVTLPEFEFEIKKSINSDWEKEIYFLATEDDSIIIDEFGRKIHMSKISDMPVSENLSEESYAMIIDEEGNKRFKVKAIADAVEDSLDTKFNAYADEISGDVERIKGEVNEISESLEGMASDIEELKQGDIEIDLTDYAKKSDLEVKVDKVNGKSLILDSEITRLATVKNYDDTEIKNTLNDKANVSDLHSHTNKTVLDGITSAKVNEWNNKSTFDGNYNNLINKPNIPTKVSQLTNDSEYLTTHQDLSDYAKKSDLEVKADKGELHSHSNKSVLDDITTSKVTEWNNKSTFDGNYNSLTNKPTMPTKTSQLNNDSGFITSIPSEYVTETELNDKGYLTQHQDISHKADKTELHSHTNKTVLDGITNAKVTEWNNKSTFSGNYNDLTNKPTIPSLNGYATEQYVNEEIEKIDVTEQLTDYAKKSELHSHSNKTVLDGISSTKVSEWNNKSNFSGNYNDLTNKPTIPTKTSQLTNDSGYITQHQDLSNYPMTSELTLGVHTDGLIYLFKGNQPVGNGVAQSTTILPEGDVVGYVDSSNNIVLSGNLSNGTYVLKYEMEDGSLIDVGQIVKEGGSGTPTIGYTNVLYLAQEYASTSVYNGKGWKEDTRYSGSAEEKEKPLANHYLTGYIPCTKKSIVRIKNIDITGNSDDYHLVTFFKGSDKSQLDGGSLTSFFAEPADDNGVYTSRTPEYYTAVQTSEETNFYFRLCALKIDNTSIITIDEEIKGEALNQPNVPSVTYRNLANPSISDWLTDKRLSSGGTIKDGVGCTVTNYIDCKYGDIVRIKGLSMENALPTETSSQIEEYDTNGTRVFYNFVNTTIADNGGIASIDSDGVVLYVVHNEATVKIRICGTTPSNVDDVIITVNQKIEGVAINYTNQVPLSIDTDGTIFNGVGYKDGYRGNSSGGLTALDGCAVTGLIPFNPATDTVRVKGVNRSSTIPSGDFGYVAIYDKSKTFLAFSNPSGHQNTNFTWVNNNYGYVDEDGSYVIYNPSLTNCYIETYISSLKDSTGYIRLCGQGTGKDMIVTINERIR